MASATNLEVRAGGDEASREFLKNASGTRVNTDVVIVEALRKEYPELKLTSTPSFACDLLAFANAGHAQATPVHDTEFFSWKQYAPPARRLDGGSGALLTQYQFGKFLYKWRSHDYILYVVSGRDGHVYSPQVTVNYVLSASDTSADELIFEAAKYASQLHEEVWVFDQGYWQKSKELWDSVQKANWEDVILDEDMKEALINDVESFFSSRETYQKLKVPWKRGIIYWGPPGNGKTISVKATMHTLYKKKEPIPTLYVKTLSSFAGPEYSLSQIFNKARQEAPCYLVFEDLDSIVRDNVRSYFLNEVDGLKNNDGILMIGSTNYLDRLDPGIAKRPSRFDRKYYFPNPNLDQRIQYCHYWQGKLSDNKDLDFPDKLCTAVAKITDKFSFAYMQEAFVAALLSIAYSKKDYQSQKSKDLEELLLWRELKKQIKILREEMEEKEGSMFQGELVCR